jgi:hypothetical protein
MAVQKSSNYVEKKARSKKKKPRNDGTILHIMRS